MKKLIFVLLMIVGGYYLYNNVFMEILGKTGPAAGLGKAAASDKLPQRAPERACHPNISKSSFAALEGAVFSLYNSKAAYALVELAYNTGMEEAPALINRYLAAFSLPEEKGRVLTLVSKFRDRESLDMLNKFFIQGTFTRKTVLSKIAEFKTIEAAEIITRAMEDQNASVRAAAEAVYNEVKDEPWFTAGNRG